MVRPLMPEQFEQEAGDAFRGVFVSTDPCDAPFSEAISERVILWGSMYKLNEAEAAVLRDYDAKVSNLLDVDDFAPHELSAGGGAGARPDS